SPTEPESPHDCRDKRVRRFRQQRARKRADRLGFACAGATAACLGRLLSVDLASPSCRLRVVHPAVGRHDRCASHARAPDSVTDTKMKPSLIKAVRWSVTIAIVLAA